MRQFRYDGNTSLYNAILRIVPIMVVLVITGCATQAGNSVKGPEPHAQTYADKSVDPLVSLESLFRQAYDDAIEYHRDTIIFDAPFIVQDFLNMTLFRPNGEQIRYSMDKTAYYVMARTSHPIIGIYSIIAIGGFGELSSEQLVRLADYQIAIDDVIEHIDELEVDEKSKQRINNILTASSEYIISLGKSGIATEDGFEEYIKPLRPLIMEHIHRGALEQLNQFKVQMNTWKSEFPNDKWEDLRVVVIGFHQPRNLYALKLFFQWLLSEPEYESRVVYAEFQHSPFGENQRRAQDLAIQLSTKVDFDHAASLAVFEDRTYLASDVMGRIARDIIGTWGTSDFRQ